MQQDISAAQTEAQSAANVCIHMLRGSWYNLCLPASRHELMQTGNIRPWAPVCCYYSDYYRDTALTVRRQAPARRSSGGGRPS
jgi:hypothetical protein